MVGLSADYLRCSLMMLFSGSHAILSKGESQRHAVMIEMCFLRGPGLAGRAKSRAANEPLIGTTHSQKCSHMEIGIYVRMVLR